MHIRPENHSRKCIEVMFVIFHHATPFFSALKLKIGRNLRASALGTFLPFAKFRFGAPEEINLGTGKRLSYVPEVPLSGSQLSIAKDCFGHIANRDSVHRLKAWPHRIANRRQLLRLAPTKASSVI